MELKSLNCPNCNSNLSIEDGLDTFYCKYCGCKVFLDGQCGAAYNAKVQIRKMEHEEKIQEKNNAQERYKIEAKKKSDKRTIVFIICLFSFLLIIFLTMTFIGIVNTAIQEKKLNGIVEQIKSDIAHGDFSSAYINSEFLHWDSTWNSENEYKWNSIRYEIIDQIKKAEAQEADNSSLEDENLEFNESDTQSGFWNWFE